MYKDTKIVRVYPTAAYEPNKPGDRLVPRDDS